MGRRLRIRPGAATGASPSLSDELSDALLAAAGRFGEADGAHQRLVLLAVVRPLLGRTRRGRRTVCSAARRRPRRAAARLDHYPLRARRVGALADGSRSRAVPRLALELAAVRGHVVRGLGDRAGAAHCCV